MHLQQSDEIHYCCDSILHAARATMIVAENLDFMHCLGDLTLGL